MKYWTIFLICLIVCGDLAAQYHTNTHNDAIYLHERALELHEIDQNAEAYNMTIKALCVLESCDFNETPLYAECLHDAGMFALLAFNDTSLFSTYMEKAINLKYDLYGFCNDYYWSKECFANGLVYLANRIEFPQNIDLWRRAIKLYEDIPNHRLMNGYTQALNNLAVNYESINVNKSIELCRKLLDINRKTQDADSLITLSNLSQFYIDIDNEKSLFYANMVLEARKKAEPIDYDKIRVSHLRVASILGRMKIYDEAISHSIEAKILAERLYGKNSAEYARSNQKMGLYYSMKGDKLKSLEYTKQAYLSPHGDKQATAANIAAIYSSLNEVDSCYKYLQESWLLFCNNYLSVLNDMSEEDRFYFVSTGLNSGLKTLPINYFLQHENHDGLKKLAFDCILFCKNIIPDCKNRNEQFKKSIVINIDSIKSYLGNNDVAIECWSDNELNWEGNGNIIVAIMRNNYQVPIYVKLPKEKIYKAYRNEYETTHAYLPLYENIWKEIIEKAQIKEGERLFLSLDDILSQTPIEHICNYDWEYMGDKYDIVRVSSTSVIPQISQELDVNSVALFGGLFYDSIPLVDSKLNYVSPKRLLGKNNMYYEISDSLASDLRSNTNYLPWTKVEIDSIQAILSNSIINIIVYQAESGTEESFKLLSGKSPNIIHISTHGFCVQPKESMDWYEYYRYCMEHSGLLMSGVLSTDSINKDSMIVEDGFLRSTEIAALDLTKTKLLVLSACKTGLGGFSPFGMFGLQRAFKAAGVETILLTLSDVDDAATCFLMTNFYRNLMKGMSKREALKEAQLLLRTDEKFKSFNYWGSFIMID